MVNRFLFMAASLSIVLSACQESDDMMDKASGISSKNLLDISVESQDSSITVISSMEEFYAFLAKRANYDISKVDTSETMIFTSREAVNKITKTGYTTFDEYAGCKDLEISFSDYQTAGKLGLIAHKTYFVSIGLVCHQLPLQANWRPSISKSPECGLLLTNPRTDDFVNADRGYRGQYDVANLIYFMHTSLVYFLDYTDAPKIWFPCSPDKLKWNVNILEL